MKGKLIDEFYVKGECKTGALVYASILYLVTFKVNYVMLFL